MKGKGLESSQKRSHTGQYRRLGSILLWEEAASCYLLVGEVCESTIKRFSCGTLKVTLGRFMSHLN